MSACAGLKLMMLDLGYRSTRTARYAIRALGLVGAFAPDIALLELDLPDMNVYRLAQVMRTCARAHQCRLSLIAVADGEAHASSVLARAAGFDGYLAKPIRLPELDHVLQSLRR
jgi:DNA-binding response OmpR family regulator